MKIGKTPRFRRGVDHVVVAGAAIAALTPWVRLGGKIEPLMGIGGRNFGLAVGASGSLWDRRAYPVQSPLEARQ